MHACEAIMIVRETTDEDEERERERERRSFCAWREGALARLGPWGINNVMELV